MRPTTCANFRGAATFAAHAGFGPVPASGGNTHRHRLARGGNRQLNRALFIIVTVQARWHPEARNYLTRKRAEGKIGAEVRKRSKRHLAAVVYRSRPRRASPDSAQRNQSPLDGSGAPTDRPSIIRLVGVVRANNTGPKVAATSVLSYSGDIAETRLANDAPTELRTRK